MFYVKSRMGHSAAKSTGPASAEPDIPDQIRELAELVVIGELVSWVGLGARLLPLWRFACRSPPKKGVTKKTDTETKNAAAPSPKNR